MASTWDFFREIDKMRREFDRMFQNLELGSWFKPIPRVSFLPGRSAREYPLVNLSEDENNIYIDALAPGINLDSLNINVTGNRLNISGEKIEHKEETESEAYHRNERSAGRFVRSVELPVDVEGEKAKADYTNGILYISMPRTEESKPKPISVHVD